jgi:hypothetical protein
MFNKEKYQIINQMMCLWNPIGVPDDIAVTEYSDYVLKTFNFKSDFIGLVNYLESILVEYLEFEYDEKNIDEKKEILYYSYLIFKEIQ